MFLHIKPRPETDDYIRASRDSMGRPPYFVGNYTTTTGVFARTLPMCWPVSGSHDRYSSAMINDFTLAACAEMIFIELRSPSECNGLMILVSR
jgi:hypothetical protein